MPARVLIVEDNPINRELVDYLLRSFGFDTLRAVDGSIGLDVAARERPDLVLCDIQMPVVDGLEFARRLRADPLLRDTPLVAVTAFAMVGDSDRILAQGFDAYVAKPIEPTELLAVVDSLLPAALRSRAAPAASTAASPRAVITARRRILVLDDIAFNRELKRDLLEPHGYEVELTASAEEAWLAVSRQAPDLILSDVGVGLDGTGGFEFIRRVKADARLRRVPFIFLSATHWDDESRRTGLALGALRYLARPLDPALVLRAIDDCLQDTGRVSAGAIGEHPSPDADGPAGHDRGSAT